MEQFSMHRYCEQWTEFDASVNYVVVGEPIAPGDWYYSDGYVTKCDEQDHAEHHNT